MSKKSNATTTKTRVLLYGLTKKNINRLSFYSLIVMIPKVSTYYQLKHIKKCMCKLDVDEDEDVHGIYSDFTSLGGCQKGGMMG